MLNFEIEVKTITGERRGEEFMKVGENGIGFVLDRLLEVLDVHENSIQRN
jgi:hypothetical protein